MMVTHPRLQAWQSHSWRLLGHQVSQAVDTHRQAHAAAMCIWRGRYCMQARASIASPEDTERGLHAVQASRTSYAGPWLQ